MGSKKSFCPKNMINLSWTKLMLRQRTWDCSTWFCPLHMQHLAQADWLYFVILSSTFRRTPQVTDVTRACFLPETRQPTYLFNNESLLTQTEVTMMTGPVRSGCGYARAVGVRSLQSCGTYYTMRFSTHWFLWMQSCKLAWNAHFKIILAVPSMKDLLAGGLFSLAALEASLFRFP